MQHQPSKPRHNELYGAAQTGKQTACGAVLALRGGPQDEGKGAAGRRSGSERYTKRNATESWAGSGKR
mgnify:CR=1 FL=1